MIHTRVNIIVEETIRSMAHWAIVAHADFAPPLELIQIGDDVGVGIKKTIPPVILFRSDMGAEMNLMEAFLLWCDINGFDPEGKIDG